MSDAQRQRARRWWRSRRLIAVIVAVDLVGAGGLVIALNRSSRPPTATAVKSTASLDYIITYPNGKTVGARTPTVRTISPVAPRSSPRPNATTLGRTADRRRSHEQRQQTLASAAVPARAQVSFERFAAGQPGAVGLAIAPLGAGPITALGAQQVGHAWSTMKVPVLTTVLLKVEGAGGRLSAQAASDASLALEQSDNKAAEALFSALEQSDGGLVGASAQVQQTLRIAGDHATIINTAPNSAGFTTWGQSDWSAVGEVTFYRAMARGCLLSPSDTGYVLHLMQNVQSDQRWGGGSSSLPSPLAFKGGWGPENGGGYLVRQTVIVGSGHRGYVFSMLARPSDGVFASGTQMLTNIASWVRRTFPLTASFPASGCA